MKRRREQEHDETVAREQADARREALLAELKAREAAARAPEPPPPAPRPPLTEAALDEPELDEPAPPATEELTGADEGRTTEPENA